MVMPKDYDQLVQKLLDDGKCVSRSEARRRATLEAGAGLDRPQQNSFREREEGNKSETGEFIAKFGFGQVPHTVKYEISPDGKTVNIEAPHTDIMGNLGTLQPGQSTKVIGIPEKLQPKKRGRPRTKCANCGKKIEFAYYAKDGERCCCSVCASLYRPK